MWDASTWELYGALLNGGTVVCINRMTVVDALALGKLIRSRRIQASMMSPAVLKQLLRYCPQSLKEFELLHIIGERFSVRDATQTRQLVPGKLFNSYGPTEATILSTSYEIPWATDSLVNEVPIGKAVEHTGIHVVDSKLRAIPHGVVGELIITSRGIARGFTNPALEKDCFVLFAAHHHQHWLAVRLVRS
jgi:non-ribosomal peptide synthetase component F